MEPHPQQNPLATLRDIHYPDPIAWWPPAPGWFITIALIILLTIGFILVCCKIYKKHTMKKTILGELDKIKQQSKQENATAALSILLKRVAISYYSRERVVTLSGQDWLVFLDQEGNTSEFTQGVGQLLLSAPYEKNTPAQWQPLFNLVEQWIRGKI